MRTAKKGTVTFSRDRAEKVTVPSMATSTQKLAVVLAFVAAVLSFVAVVMGYVQTGTIRVTPLGGGAVMLALAISGYKRITAPRA
jgi:hypothetical protein